MPGKTVHSLLQALLAFYSEHHPCGHVTSGVRNGRLEARCVCGAEMIRSLALLSDDAAA
jgi:hypothetical protein